VERYLHGKFKDATVAVTFLHPSSSQVVVFEATFAVKEGKCIYLVQMHLLFLPFVPRPASEDHSHSQCN
jgi:hypothetical protein